MSIRFVDEFEGGFGWVAAEYLQRCSHALVVGGRVWIVDPVAGEGVEERIRAAGEPAGVIQLLDRHKRDCASLARSLAVPHHFVPEQPIRPFEFRRIRMNRWWREVALWWPERRVLVCGDTLGTVAYFHAGAERLGLHPLLRFRPPRRQLEGLAPVAVLCGHGAGIFEDAEGALREALSTARRRIPAQVASAVRSWRVTRSR